LPLPTALLGDESSLLLLLLIVPVLELVERSAELKLIAEVKGSETK
jgi:hypothetical protein